MKTILGTEIDPADEALFFDRRAACQASNETYRAVLAAEEAVKNAKATLKAARAKHKPIQARYEAIDARWMLTPSGGRYDDYVYRDKQADIFYSAYLKRKAAREVAGIKTAAA